LAAALILVLMLGANYWMWKKIFRVYPEARVEMRQVFQQIPLGATRAQVRNHFSTKRYQTLELRVSEPSLWRVDTPFEIGAKNWKLFLEWSRDELVAKRLRTPDGVDIRPARFAAG
jgi:hypothetical protein